MLPVRSAIQSYRQPTLGEGGEGMASKFRAGLVAVTLLMVTAGCGTATETTPPLAPSDCPASGGPDGGSLTGLGATVGAFRTVHGPQDPKYPTQFGKTISGGPNDGLPEFTAHCSTAGIIAGIAQAFEKGATGAAVKQALGTYGIMPADAQLVSDTTPTSCRSGPSELLVYKSPSLAGTPDAQDPPGTFVVDLSTASKLVYDILYDLDTTGAC
jgi:hypothetical protein